MGFVLAIDGGSQSTKVSVVDETGRVHATGRVPLRAYELGSHGRAVHPQDDLWDSLVGATRACLADFGGEPADIVAIGLCGIRSCRAYVAADGELTEPVLSWMDPRVDAPLDDLPPTATMVTSAGGYLTVRLTGVRRDSAAAYAGMWPIDIDAGDWSTDPEQLVRTGMAQDLLPELVAPGEVLGGLTRRAAAALGLAEDCPVIATANDKAVEALGSGLIAPGEVLLSLGTYVAAMTPLTHGDDAPSSTDPRVWRNSAAVPGAFLAESAGVRRGMSTVSWTSDLTGEAVEDLEDAAWRVPPGSNGLVTVPDWLAPADAPYRRGAILGLTGGTGRGHLHRSVLEGLLVTMAAHIEAMEESLDIRHDAVILSGGGSRSTLLRRIAADVLHRPVHVLENPDGAGVGSAICAAVGAGLHPDFGSAVAAMVRRGPTTEPEPDAVTAYVEVREVYARAREHLEAFFSGEP